MVLKTRPRKTVDDYMKLPEGTLAELIEGEILMSPSPKDRHQKVVGNLYLHLRLFIDSRKLGLIRMAPFDVHLPSEDVVQPDVIFVSTKNRKMVKDWIYGAPDLLIEVVSAEGVARDQIVKRALYARNGVPEYWIVDPEAKGIEVLQLRGSEYVPHAYFEEADTLGSPVLSGLNLSVREIFE